MTRKAFLFLPLMLITAACASSSGIHPASADKYTVTESYARIRGGAETARQVAMTKAEQYCKHKAQRLLVDANQEPTGNTTYSMTFRCIPPGDQSFLAGSKEQLRPNFQQIQNQPNRTVPKGQDNNPGSIRPNFQPIKL